MNYIKDIIYKYLLTGTELHIKHYGNTEYFKYLPITKKSLYISCLYNHFEFVKLLISKLYIFDENTCIFMASKGGHFELIMFLLKKFKLNHYFVYLMSGAAQGGHLKIIDFFKNLYPEKFDAYIIFLNAAEGGHLNVVLQYITEYRENYWTSITCSIRGGNMDIFNLFYDKCINENYRYWILTSIKYNNVKLFKFLMSEQEEKINEKYETDFYTNCMVEAILNQNMEMINSILDYKENIKEKINWSSCANEITKIGNMNLLLFCLEKHKEKKHNEKTKHNEKLDWNWMLLNAIKSGCINIMLYCYKQMTNKISFDYNWAIAIASGRGHLHFVKFFIKECKKQRLEINFNTSISLSNLEGHSNVRDYLKQEKEEFKTRKRIYYHLKNNTYIINDISYL